MEFYISKHATDQMNVRGIEESVVSDILNSPQQIINDEDKTVYQSIIIEDGKRFLIRVFVNHLRVPKTVITVYKTSKIEKYYEGNL